MPASVELSAPLKYSDPLTIAKISESPTATISLRSAFNAAAPANHLPTELVAKILTSGAFDYWWDLVSLTHICQHWRNVALGTPQLWAEAVQFAMELLEPIFYGENCCPMLILPMLLPRSVPCPLRFELRMASHLAWLVHGPGGTVVNPHFSRLAHLSVEVENTDDIKTVLRVVHSHTRNLESLHLTRVDRRSRGRVPMSTDEPPSWEDMDLPHLHTLTIPGHCFTESITVASLKTLVLSYGPQSHDSFIATLARCSLILESLTLHLWAHPHQATNAPASATRVVVLPNLRHLKIVVNDEPLNSSHPTLLFASLSLPPHVAIDIDWRRNPEQTHELLPRHMSSLQFDAVSLHLSGPPQQANVQCYVGGTEHLRVRARPNLSPGLDHNPRSFIAKFLDAHRYPTATQLAVDLDVFWLDKHTSLVQDNVLRQFVAAFPNLRRLDLLGKTTSGRANLAMAEAFLSLPHPAVLGVGAGNVKTLGYVCEVSERHKVQNPIEFVDTLRAQLDDLEALLATHPGDPRSVTVLAAAGGSRLHRLELCIAYTTLDPHPPPEAYPYIYRASASTELTAYVSSAYLPRFGRLVDEVVFIGDVKRRGPGYQILTPRAARQPEAIAIGPKRVPLPVTRSRGGTSRPSVRMRGR
ncbi:hypothetical protein V8D89_002088 [Ganoderma adspersum]